MLQLESNEKVVLVLPTLDCSIDAVVESQSEDGPSYLRVEGSQPLSTLAQGQTAEVHYYRGGELRIAWARVTDVADERRLGNGWWLSLSSPQGGRAQYHRRFTRLPISMPTRFAVGPTTVVGAEHKDFDSHLDLHGRAAQIEVLSAGGVTLQSEADLDVSDQIVVELELPEGEIAVRGRVVSKAKTKVRQFGIEFVEVSETQRRSLSSFVRKVAVNRQRLALAEQR